MTSQDGTVAGELAVFHDANAAYCDKSREATAIENERTELMKRRAEALDRLYEALRRELGDEFGNFAFRFRDADGIREYWQRKLDRQANEAAMQRVFGA